MFGGNSKSECPAIVEKAMVNSRSLVGETADGKKSVAWSDSDGDWYRSFFELCRDALFITDADGRVVAANESAAILVGCSRRDLIDMNIGDFSVWLSDRESFWSEVLTKGHARDTRVRLRRKDGSETDCLLSATVSQGDDGGITYFHYLIRRMAQYESTFKALQESEQRYRLLAENLTDVIWIMDTNLKLTYISPSVTHMRGYSIEEVMSQKLDEFFTPASLKVALRLVAEELGKGKRGEQGSIKLGTVALEMTRKDGSTIWTESRVTLMYDADGRPAGLMGATRDVTERREMERVLRESERSYRLLAENVSDVIWITDMNWRRVYVSPSASRLTGLPFEEHLAQKIQDVLTPASYEATMKALKRQMAIEKKRTKEPQRSWTLQLEMRRRDGSTVWTEDKMTFLRDPDGKAVGILGVTRDITERKHAEDALRALSCRLVEVQETERRQVARELHDHIGQELTGLKFLLEMTSRLPAHSLRGKLNEALASINELVERVQDLSLDLRPAMLDDLGLVPALLWHFERLQSQTGMWVNFSHRGIHRRFDPEIETAVYRIVQEALTNVARHAGVKEASVRLVVNRGLLSVYIEDRGIGFDVEDAMDRGTSSGLTGMQERAVLLGGHLKVNSSPGGGTRVVASFPRGSVQKAVRDW
jgi:PAS domain S-box-containing protein